ncbi:MAG: hypothetical protein J5I47_11425 [Vicingus serpentipes]|nr:hypothetical protein [Vicingus serpentipes]
MSVKNKANLFFGLLVLAIFPYCYLSFFAQPIAEDFGFAHYYQKSEFLALLKNSYLKMNGRYIANVLMYLNPLSFNCFLGYQFIPLLLIFFTVVGNLFLVNQTFPFLSLIKRIIIAFAVTLLFLCNLPIISEGIYWYTAAVIYQGGIICALFYMATFIKTIGKNQLLGKVILTMLLFLLCGFNEVLTLLVVFFLLAITVLAFLNKKYERKAILWQCIFAILFASILIFSPGNSVREGMYENNNKWMYSLVYSTLQVVRFSFSWIFSLGLVTTSFLYLLVHEEWKKHSEVVRNSFYLNRWTALALLLCTIFICVFPAYWATGILGQHRTLNVAYFFFLIMWFLNLSVWMNSFKNKIKLKRVHQQKHKIAVMFLLGILLTGNGYDAMVDIFSGDAHRFNKELNERHAILQEATKNHPSAVVLKPLTARPKTLFVTEISTEAKFWTNQGYNTYFNLNPDSTAIYIAEE